MAQYAPPSAARARSPPPPPRPLPLPSRRPSTSGCPGSSSSRASSLLFPSLSASASPDGRGRSQDVRPAASVVRAISGAAEPDWSLVLPSPASRSTSYQRSAPPPLPYPAAAPSVRRDHQSDAHPLRRHDRIRASALKATKQGRPNLPPRTASEQTYGWSSLDELGTDAADDFSSLASTTDDFDSSASDRELSPARSATSSSSPPFGPHTLAGTTNGLSANSSPSLPPAPELDSLSRVSTIVGLSNVRPHGSSLITAPADTAGFRPTFGGAWSGPRARSGITARERRHTLGPRLEATYRSAQAPTAGVSEGFSAFGWTWPFRACPAPVWLEGPPSSASSPAILAKTIHFLRSLLILDEDTLLLLFAASLVADSSEKVDRSEKASRVEDAVPVFARGCRTWSRQRSSSFDPGSDSRRALLLRAVGRVASRSQVAGV